MSFIINQNFDLKSPQFNFARDYFADVASLKAASENDFPDHFITNVGGVLYQLTKSNSVDSTTGKWRKLILGSDVNLSGYATTTSLNNHINNTKNPHSVTKAQVGLSNVDNTSDAAKPISTATKNALDTKAAKSEAIGTLDVGIYKNKLVIGGQRVDGTKVSGKDIPLASYSVTSDEENTQKAGLITGAERKRLDALGLSGKSFSELDGTKGLRLVLNGTNSSVDIDIVKPGNDSTYGLMSGADKTKLDGIAANANNYSLPTAANNVKGGIALGYSETDKNYAVKLDNNNKAYVTVPWVNTDTKYSLPVATKDALGGIKIGFSTNVANHNYALLLSENDSHAYTNVPLATYNILNDTNQNDGLVTGAERRAINLLSLSGLSLANDGGFQLTLGGVIGDNNSTVVIPFVTTGMNDVSYGLMRGSDKNKLDSIEKGANKTTITGTVAQGNINAVSSGGVYAALSGKVDKVTGKGLSTNDFTADYKIKLDNITTISKSEIDNLFT